MSEMPLDQCENAKSDLRQFWYKIQMCSKAKVKLGLEREHKARQSSRHVEERAAHGRRLEANIINIARIANAVQVALW